MKWFVMVRTQSGVPLPLTDLETDDVHLFDSEQDAVDAAKKNLFGEHFGYEVYDW